MADITGGSKFTVIKVANLLLQIYDWLLIASLGLNITVTNRRVSSHFANGSGCRFFIFSIFFFFYPLRSLPGQFPKPQCHWPKCVTPNRPRRKFRPSIHVRPHSSAIALYQGCPSFLHFTALRLDFALSARTAARFRPPQGHSLKGEAG